MSRFQPALLGNGLWFRTYMPEEKIKFICGMCSKTITTKIGPRDQPSSAEEILKEKGLGWTGFVQDGSVATDWQWYDYAICPDCKDAHAIAKEY